MAVVGYDVLLILDVVHDSSLHLENAIFVQCSHELLSSVDLVLYIGDS